MAMQGKQIAVLVDGKPQHYAMPPRMMNSRVMVPMREIFQSLGATVNWDAKQRMVSAMRGATEVKLRIGDREAMVNRKRVMLEEPSKVKAGKIKFDVVNDGTLPHALAIEAMTVKSETLSPGQKTAVTADLKPGTYTLYCPIGGHRALGVVAKLTVE